MSSVKLFSYLSALKSGLNSSLYLPDYLVISDLAVCSFYNNMLNFWIQFVRHCATCLKCTIPFNARSRTVRYKSYYYVHVLKCVSSQGN